MFRTVEAPGVRTSGDPFVPGAPETSTRGATSSCQRLVADQLGSAAVSVSPVVGETVEATAEADIHIVSATAIEARIDGPMRLLPFVVGGAVSLSNSAPGIIVTVSTAIVQPWIEGSRPTRT